MGAVGGSGVYMYIFTVATGPVPPRLRQSHATGQITPDGHGMGGGGGNCCKQLISESICSAVEI